MVDSQGCAYTVARRAKSGERAQAGILNELVRISVRCEDCEEFRDDLDHALNQIPLGLDIQGDEEKELDELMEGIDK